MKPVLLKPKPTPWIGFYQCSNCESIFEVDKTDEAAEADYDASMIAAYLHRQCPSCSAVRVHNIFGSTFPALVKISEDKAIAALEKCNET